MTAATASNETVQWQPTEIRLVADGEHDWWEFPVTATFVHDETGRELELEGFWDGNDEWIIRFAAPLAGRWHWETNATDDSLDGATGSLSVRRPTDDEREANPNYRGHVSAAESGRFFEYADGTPCFLLADTVWGANTARCGLGEDRDGPFFEYLDDRERKGFTTVLLNFLYGFGDIEDNPGGDRNEGGYAFVDRDFERLNPAYVGALDERLDAIWRRGFLAAIPFTWWGKTDDCAFSSEWARRISAYLVVRYGAYNALWALSGEYQYAFHDCDWTEEDFHRLGRTVQEHNPYGHPVSIHPSGRTDWPEPHNVQSSQPFHGAEWLDHHWLQTGQSRDRMHNIVGRAAENRALEPTLPVFCSEAFYERLNDSKHAYHARWQPWVAFLNGCAGYGYATWGLQHFYDPDDPEGETGSERPGAAPWREALAVEGSAQVGRVQSLLADRPWWDLEPRRDSLRVDGGPCPDPTPDDLTPPHCAAVPGELYVLYIPRGNAGRSLELTGLDSQTYEVTWYDPRSGEPTPAKGAAEGQSAWLVPERPAPADEDWALVLERAD